MDLNQCCILGFGIKGGLYERKRQRGRHHGNRGFDRECCPLVGNNPRGTGNDAMPPFSPPHPGMLNLYAGSQWSRGLFRAMWWTKHGPWNQERPGSGPKLLLPNSVTLGKLFQISELTFPHLQNETNHTCLLVLLCVVNDIQYVKYLTHKYSTNLGLFPSLLLRVAHISQETHLDQSEQHYITNTVFKSQGNRILQFCFSKNIKVDWNSFSFLLLFTSLPFSGMLNFSS